MQTPWGELKRLDLENHEFAAEILSADKHQLVEGLVVESLFDQIVADFPADAGSTVIPLDIESIVVDTKRDKERLLIFVWVRNPGDGLGRYLKALENSFVPYLVTFEAGDFTACRISNGRRQAPPQLLHELMQELSPAAATPFVVDAKVKDSNRQRQSFWGFISNFHKEELAKRIVLPRILINCGIQPYFRSVWNLDRIFLIDGTLWLFEIKHKFPMSRDHLSFGINDGELAMLNLLGQCGIRCLHTILVKPFWSKDVGSMYLFNDLSMRARAGLIATVLDDKAISKMMGGRTGRSGAHTSITGLSSLSFKQIAAVDFAALGLLSDPHGVLSRSITSVIRGLPTTPVTDEWLLGLKASELPGASVRG